MTYDIDITIQNKNWLKQIENIEAYSKKVITGILRKISNNVEHTEISIVLADNVFIQNLNKEYRHKDKPTNVLSFPITEPDEAMNNIPFLALGDIIIALETIQNEAKDQNKSIQDHFTHMLVHGCLHLFHYDHFTDVQALEMEALEIEILDGLGIKNPYEDEKIYGTI